MRRMLPKQVYHLYIFCYIQCRTVSTTQSVWNHVIVGTKHLYIHETSRPRPNRLSQNDSATIELWRTLLTLLCLRERSYVAGPGQHAIIVIIISCLFWDLSGCHRIATRQRQGARSWPWNRVPFPPSRMLSLLNKKTHILKPMGSFVCLILSVMLDSGCTVVSLFCWLLRKRYRPDTTQLILLIIVR